MKTHVIALRASIAVALNSGLMWFDRFVEWAVYPWYIGHDGPVMGLTKIVVFSFVVCLILLIVYDTVCKLDATKIKNEKLRALVEATNDVLGYETAKEIGAEAWDDLFVPVAITPAREHDGIRVRVRWFLRAAHALHLARPLRYVRKTVNAVRHGYTLIDNLRLRVWEPIRRKIVAPAALSLARYNLERLALFLAVAFASDAMTTTIVMRPAHSHRFRVREFLLYFFPGLILSCLGWGFVVIAFFEVVRLVGQVPWVMIFSSIVGQ